MVFELPKLPYSVDALEPYIDAKTMEIHHGKHHQGYVDKLNKALVGHDDLGVKKLEDLLSGLNDLPEDIKTAVRNSGGGHFNHSLFWNIMGPKAGGEPTDELAEAINDTFGDFGTFKAQFSEAAAQRFGSGWAWLIITNDGQLRICSTSNQDNPLMPGVCDTPATPIMALDVWEHAYYLQYQNRRPDYIENWWNVVDWTQVANNYQQATGI